LAPRSGTGRGELQRTAVMKIKIGTVMDAEIVRKLKELSARDGRPFSDLLQDAAVHYLDQRPRMHELRSQSVDHFCSKPFELRKSDILKMMEEEIRES
jgi:hypothetical protein